jgi:hypothetical protein
MEKETTVKIIILLPGLTQGARGSAGGALSESRHSPLRGEEQEEG